MTHGIALVICACFAEFIPEGMDGDAFLEQAVGPTCDLLRQGKRVLVHCNGGKGRTGAVTLPRFRLRRANRNE